MTQSASTEGMGRVPISVIVHTRNEERNIAACLESVAGWAREILVMDMESSDATCQIARRYTRRILAHPLVRDFDVARNASARQASESWVLFLDADERMTPGLAARIEAFLRDAPSDVAAGQFPHCNYFLGTWIRHAGQWYPGYKAPTLLRKGRFEWRPYVHEGPAVDGKVVRFPADGPDYSILHFSYPDLRMYVEKLNRYTEGEAAKREAAGADCTWESIAERLGRMFRWYLDDTHGRMDGPHGLLLALCGMTYEVFAGMKHAERRLAAGWSGDGLIPPTAEAFLGRAAEEAGRRRPAERAGTTTVSPPAEAPRRMEARKNAAPGPEPPAQVVWQAPLFDPSGYADEARQFVLGLRDLGVSVRAVPLEWNSARAQLSSREAAALGQATQVPIDPGRTVVSVSHIFPPHFRRHPEASLQVGRTMFETDRIPADWVAACNRMDEVWVPSDFNLATFAGAGVEPGKLRKIPGGIDPRPFRLDAPPLEIANRRRFQFVSVFDWSLRKGWDILLRAFVEEFAESEEVGLVLKVWSSSGWPVERMRAQALHVLRASGAADRIPAHVTFLERNLSTAELPSLYRAADAFVLPTRGEGWGRPYMEAMLMGLPVIATRWSGHLEFMDDETAFLLECAIAPVEDAAVREAPHFRGHRWAEPSVEHLRRLMRQVATDREEGARRGLAARTHILSHFTRYHVARQVADRVQELAARSRSIAPQSAPRSEPQSAEPLAVVWEGSQFVHHSLALVNRELCLRLIDRGHEVTILPFDPDEFDPGADDRLRPLAERVRAPLSQPAEIHVRHHWPPNFTPPPQGRWVVIQPWEYGSIPKSWVEPMSTLVDEIWVPTTFVRDCYIRSGIPGERVAVVPNGVDCRRFRPDAPPIPLQDGAVASRIGRIGPDTFKFLFVGGTIIRKGIDILLQAYLHAFTAADDVCLVIKDIGTQTIYRGQNWEAMIRRIQATPEAPAVIYRTDDLLPAELPGLYTACDCLVHPYRGEGFGLPIAEAMACGLPALVTGYGAALDFCGPETAYLIPAREVQKPRKQVGTIETVDHPWQAEVDVSALIGLMRRVVRERDEAKARGARAAEHIRRAFTWEHAAEIAEARLLVLRTRAPRRERLGEGSGILRASRAA